MIPRFRAPRNVPPWVLAAAALAVLVAGFLSLQSAAVRAVGRRIEAAAALRGLDPSWKKLSFRFPGRITVAGLKLADAGGDTVFVADTLDVHLQSLSLFTGNPRIASVRLAHARARSLKAPAESEEGDETATEPPAENKRRRGRPTDRPERVRAAARSLIRVLFAPARAMPRLAVSDVTLELAASGDEPPTSIRIGRLDLTTTHSGARLEANGIVRLERESPFEVHFEYGIDNRLVGWAELGVPGSTQYPSQSLRAEVAGWLVQDRKHRQIILDDSTRVHIGDLPLRVGGRLESQGPRIVFRLAADEITSERIAGSVPAAILGPLLDVAVTGSFDYRLAFDLDLQRPDDVDFHADVIPHGLRLDGAHTRLPLLGLDQPFVATIHLPRGRRVTRLLASRNPHYRPLAAIDSTLAYAVVTNEDGGFFRHRGFNVEAVKASIAENIRAGAYRRGAGTITMQLARNLYLGHERTLSRKGQEVVLAWVLEHLTGLPKRRLLEIYLNIIEWGPGVHGADEATFYYFGHDASRVTVSEALFLSTVVPAPTKWRFRFDRDGRLQAFERAQMHFIGRAMVAKGWLSPSALPPAEELRVALTGRALVQVFPDLAPDSTTAGIDSAAVVVPEDEPDAPH